MASSVKACDQMPPIRAGYDVLQHRLLNKLAASLRAKFASLVPELPLKYGSKSTSGHTVSATLAGVVASPNPQVVAETEEKVRKLMDKIRNPLEFEALLKE